MADGSRVTLPAWSFISSPRVLRSPTDSLAVRKAILLRDSLLVRLLPVLLSQYLPFRVSAPIRYGWYCGWWRCSKVPVRWPFFGSPLDSPFFVLWQSLLAAVVSPCSRSRRDFVALSCLLRYWLGFYLNWQLVTTVSPFLHTGFFTSSIWYASPFPQVKRLSILVANSC